MKAQFRNVDIQVSDGVARGISISRWPRGNKRNVFHYPLTERNYWRAVGMQLKLAGFALGAPSVVRVCSHAENHELYWGRGDTYCPHCGARLLAEFVKDGE